MEKSPFDLYVSPMEDRHTFGESTYYTKRTPGVNLQHPSDAFIQTIRSIAGVAFHGKEGKIRFFANERDIPNLRDKTAILGDSAILEYEPVKDNEMVLLGEKSKVTADCVDRRLEDKGADPFDHTAQFTHAGSLIMLDPLLRDVVPPHIIKYLEEDVIERLLETRTLISRISAHFGLNGVSGCGGVNLLRQNSETAREILNSPFGVKQALARVREEYNNVMATDCALIGDVIYPGGGKIGFYMDDRDDFNNMMETGDLNI